MQNYEKFEEDKDTTDFKPLYCYLFNGITDIINDMERNAYNPDFPLFREEFVHTIGKLKALQIGSEEMYIEQGVNEP